MTPAWPAVGALLAVVFALVSPRAVVRTLPVDATTGSGTIRPGEAWIDRWRSSPRRIDAALPDFVDDLARSLHSGATLTEALADAGRLEGPLARDLRQVAIDVDLGAPVGEALRRWESRRPGTRVGLVVAVVDLALVAGGEPVTLLTSVADSMRDEEAVVAESRALATQARASAAVVCLAPLGFAVLTSPFRSGSFLSGASPLLVLLGLGLDAVGLWWMWRITRPGVA